MLTFSKRITFTVLEAMIDFISADDLKYHTENQENNTLMKIVVSNETNLGRGST
jgi:hypothetical protein